MAHSTEMGTESTTYRWGTGPRLLAVVVSLIFVATPFRGLAQASGETGGGEADESVSDDEETSDGDGEVSEPSQDASEARNPRVSLLPTQGATRNVSASEMDRIDALLRGFLEANGSVELLPRYEGEETRRRKSAPRNSEISRARELYEAGVGRARDGEFERAAEALKKAIDLMRANIGQVRDFELYTDALLKLAWSYWEMGHNYDARKTIREYAHLRPGVELASETYPADLREIYSSEVQRVEKAGAGRLVVESETSGAEVIIDGERKGRTPQTVTDVQYGYHYLVVRGSDGTFVEKIRVRGRGNEQVYRAGVEGLDTEESSPSTEKEGPAFYEELVDDIGDGAFGVSLQPQLTTLAERSGSSFVAWVVTVRRNGAYVATPFVFGVEDGVLLRGESVSFGAELSGVRDEVRVLSEALAEVIRTQPPERAVSSVALPEDPETSEESPRAPASSEENRASRDDEGPDAEAAGRSVRPPPTPTSEESEPSGDAWTYIGIGGAAVVVGALVAGGVVFLGDTGGESEPESFSATVTW